MVKKNYHTGGLDRQVNPTVVRQRQRFPDTRARTTQASEDSSKERR